MASVHFASTTHRAAIHPAIRIVHAHLLAVAKPLYWMWNSKCNGLRQKMPKCYSEREREQGWKGERIRECSHVVFSSHNKMNLKLFTDGCVFQINNRHMRRQTQIEMKKFRKKTIKSRFNNWIEYIVCSRSREKNYRRVEIGSRRIILSTTLHFLQIAYFVFVIVRTLKLKYHFDNECVSHMKRMW